MKRSGSFTRPANTRGVASVSSATDLLTPLAIRSTATEPYGSGLVRARVASTGLPASAGSSHSLRRVARQGGAQALNQIRIRGRPMTSAGRARYRRSSWSGCGNFRRGGLDHLRGGSERVSHLAWTYGPPHAGPSDRSYTVRVPVGAGGTTGTAVIKSPTFTVDGDLEKVGGQGRHPIFPGGRPSVLRMGRVSDREILRRVVCRAGQTRVVRRGRPRSAAAAAGGSV